MVIALVIVVASSAPQESKGSSSDTAELGLNTEPRADIRAKGSLRSAGFLRRFASGQPFAGNGSSGTQRTLLPMSVRYGQLREAGHGCPVVATYSLAALTTAEASLLVTTGTTSKSIRSLHWRIQVMSRLRSSHSMS